MDRRRRNRSLETQLVEAVNNGEPRSVELLLLQGASPDLVGKTGVAAIHLAVGKETEKNIRCLKILLQHGADPNARSAEGLTPLHIAAAWGCYQNLKLLLMNGGNPNMKDTEGNTPGQLAEQQENRKCAQLLQEHQASSVGTQEDDKPHFQYSKLSDQTDMSGYPDSDDSFSSQASLISDFAEAPLSSTRCSSMFNASNSNGMPSSRMFQSNRPSDVHINQNNSAHWIFEGPSMLSSTRMSSVAPVIPAVNEEELFHRDGTFSSKPDACCDERGRRTCPSTDDTHQVFPSRQESCKSAALDSDEPFPVFSPESHKHLSATGNCTNNLSFDLSEYSGFLDSQRMATVLHRGLGIDVTSPDHVYVFCRDGSEQQEENMEKTVISHKALEDSDEETDDESVKAACQELAEQPAHPSEGSCGSATGSSHYSSCDSEPYTSTLNLTLPSKCPSLPAEDKVSAKRTDGVFPPDQIEPQPEKDLNMLEKLTCDEGKHLENGVADVLCKASKVQPETDTQVNNTGESQLDFQFTLSPFVTGRTRSRLTRCSQRESGKSLLFTSSLFEDTLPTPVRTLHKTPKSQRGTASYSSPQVSRHTPSCSGDGPAPDSRPADSGDSWPAGLRDGSCLSGSTQDDTFILPKSVAERGVASETLNDTVVPEQNPNSSADAYERNLREVILAIEAQGKDLPEDGDFLTDDVTSTEGTTEKVKISGDPHPAEIHQKQENSRRAADRSFQPDSMSSSSGSSCFSPRRSREDSHLSGTPGTGCTPRYSINRLSSYRRPSHLVEVSYTPGGRPHLQDASEPIEYLYTDTERGHKLIETHVPPAANTSLSSNTTGGEETLLYDWRSMQTGAGAGKENRKVPEQNESADRAEERLLRETEGMTDKQLRQRLVELGENPGPISNRTRPAYMRRLRALLTESNCQTPRQQKPSEPEKTEPDLGFSPELNLALRTFNLPDCQADEQALSRQFDQPDQNRKWREGVIKSSFNYLLLDPRVTANLPFRSHTMTPQECFQTFIGAVFYVGKGKRSRPYSHLYEALEYYKGDKTSKKLCPKVLHILQVWNTGLGVISLHCFQNVIPVEAYTREACMVEAIGLKMLSNQKRGDFYGVVSNWVGKRKRELGVHLLYRAMQIFLAEGERQLRPADIRQ